MRHIGPLRVPIAAAIFLVYLPLAGIFPTLPGAALIRGLFDLRALTSDGDVEWMIRTFGTFFAAYLAIGLTIVAVYQSAAMIHDLAAARFGTPRVATPWLGMRGYKARLIVALPAMLAMIASLQASLDGHDPPKSTVVTVVIITFAAAILVVLLLELTIWLFRSKNPGGLRVYQRLLTGASARFDTRGFVASPEVPAGIDPFPHHAWASIFLIFSFFIWFLVGVWALCPALQACIRVPALCSLFVLLMVGTWLLSSFTFFFDFYRIPVLTLSLLPIVAIGMQGHVYSAPRSQTLRPLVPANMVKARIGTRSGRIVAITAAGGGIQAAAWTTRVLQGLVEVAGPQDLEKFLQRIVVVSGVSGGSVGLAPFVLALDTKQLGLLDGEVAEAARTSSLDRVAATYATVDMTLPMLLPDRGFALQNAWAASWGSIHLPTETLLGSLRKRRRAPGVMFNATSMTTGERLIFGTTVPTRPLSRELSFLHSAVVEAAKTGARTPEYRAMTVVPDIDIATAARLSATFPLVSPAARCDGCDGVKQYVVDGGYIDNTGVESMAEWLEALLSDRRMRQVSATVVQIVPFCEEEREKEHVEHWPPSQVAVPLRTLYRIRGPGQARRSINALVDLEREFSGRLCIHSFVYHRCRDDHDFNPPLSWHLTKGQSEDVARTWGEEDIAEAKEVVAEALGERSCFEPSVEPSRAAPQKM